MDIAVFLVVLFSALAVVAFFGGLAGAAIAMVDQIRNAGRIGLAVWFGSWSLAALLAALAAGLA